MQNPTTPDSHPTDVLTAAWAVVNCCHDFHDGAIDMMTLRGKIDDLEDSLCRRGDEDQEANSITKAIRERGFLRGDAAQSDN